MANVPAIPFDGSKPLQNNMHERYARLRAAALPRAVAYRKAGNTAKNDDVAEPNSIRLEKKRGVRERIEYLTRQQEELIPEKRRRLEEALWSMHEADIGNFFETVEVAKSNKEGKLETDEDGKMLMVKKQRPRLFSELPADIRKQIEHIHVDSKGNMIPQLYSRAQANAELRKMLNIGGQRAPEQSDVSRLSDIELIQQLADQAKELGIEIDLNYSFAKPVPAASEPTEVNEVIDNAVAPGTADCSGANERDAQAARELTISAQPAIPQRRSGPAEAGARKLNKAARNDKR
jgi:hypothetical protein